MSDRVEVETLKVGQGGGRDLLADLYRPPTPNGCGVLLIYGGGFTEGDRRQLAGYGIALGRAGYTSLACEYRLAGEALWPAAIEDTQTAFNFLHAEAKSFGLSASKLAASGNSAGGCLSLLLAGTSPLPVAAAIAFYAPMDFLSDDARSKGSPKSMRYLLGDDVSEDRLRDMSPINHVAPTFAPTLLLTGNRDATVDWKESLRMCEALNEAGSHCELHVFDGVGHVFDMVPEYGRLSSSLMTRFLDSHVLATSSNGLMS
ncbi:MAG TPA: alpha/beta hydrolase [Acidimicrobiales bacterium]|nr:alpha/beta hydrolase [Acidimicrobiales bacterium]